MYRDAYTIRKKFGLKVIDFHFHIIPTNDGRYVTIIAPFSKLIKTNDNNGNRIFINPETGQSNIEMQVAEHLHLGNASKKWQVNFTDLTMMEACLKDGKGRLQSLYDFTAKAGARDLVHGYLNSQA